MDKLSVVAIIGRTNVGKSALFNRLIGRRKNLVDATPGLTRDRLYGDVEWEGVSFRVVDTGGVQFDKGSRIGKAIEIQVAKALEESVLALLVCDGREGLTPLDSEAAQWLRRRGKPVLVVINKIDNEKDLPAIHEFSRLGFGEPMPISALHGVRVDDLLDRIVERLPKPSGGEAAAPSQAIRVAIVGRPNVGKSSLVNALLKEERVLVDEAAGTTRDPVDSYLTVGDQLYCIIDTAGIRLKRRLRSRVDAVVRLKAMEAVERCDVCLGVLDATMGIVQDDLKLLDQVISAGRPICLVVNKWDRVPTGFQPDDVLRGVARRAAFLRFFPVVCTSAKTGYNVLRTLEQAKDLSVRAGRSISVQEKEELLETLRTDPKTSPAFRSGRFTQLVQVSTAPPTFHLSVRLKGTPRSSDLTYVESVFRRELGLQGIPIRIHLLKKGRRKR